MLLLIMGFGERNFLETCYVRIQSRRITKSARLEKNTEIIKSSCQPITTTSANHVPKYYICPLSLNALNDVDSTISLSSLFQCTTTLSEKTFFPNIQREPPLTQLKFITSCPIASLYLKFKSN